jgi:cyclophilin family peptidyl-prolyl cis-trans isomerase
MCKKRRYFIKTKIHRSVLWITFLLHLFIPLDVDAQVSNLLADTEDQLNEAIIQRDFDTLWALKDHADLDISYRASMALVHSEPVQSEWLFQQVVRSKSVRDWIILSHSDLNSDLMLELQRLYIEEEVTPELACEVFYRQGVGVNLEFLLKEFEEKTIGERCAMALGGLFSEIEVSDAYVYALLNIYEMNLDQNIRRNLLYGFFRSELNRPQPQSENHTRLANLFTEHTNSSSISLLDEYFVRSLGAEGVDIALQNRPFEQIIANPQFAVELAKAAAKAENEDELIRFTETMIQHPNTHVKLQLLESLNRSEHLNSELVSILDDYLTLETDNPQILLSYYDLMVSLGQDISGLRQSLNTMIDTQPYLADHVYRLKHSVMNKDEYITMLLNELKGEGIRSYRASEALWNAIENGSVEVERGLSIKKEMLSQILQKNRSVFSSARQIFSKIHLNEDEITEIVELYLDENQSPASDFARELYSLLAEVVPSRVSELPEPRGKIFRRPDMNVLAGMGNDTQWVLRTNRGEVRILLYPNEAPFTVSSIYHLTESGFYDDVAFHRVVRNFVIQGGDFDRRDGFGGPSYRIPTEPSVETFSRGKVGIASSGPDTEGSQFFITHSWSPHLDGLYTIFGEVVQGMNIVDQIQIGDTVLEARIE